MAFLRTRALFIVPVAIAALCFLFFTQEATAGNWHQNPKVCSDCHVMHASITDSGTLYNAGAGYMNMLKGSNTNALCLNCHASNGAAAIGTFRVAGDAPVDSWAAGWFGGNAVYTTAAGDADFSSGYAHNLDYNVSAVPPPGAVTGGEAFREAGATKALNCASCHSPHGNTNYRNLQYDPNTRNAAIFSCTVTVAVADTGAKTTEVWKAANNAYQEGMSSFCQDCHEKFGPAAAWGGPPGGDTLGVGFYTNKYDDDGQVDNQVVATNANSHHPIDYDLQVGASTTGTNYNTNVGRDTYPLGFSTAATKPWASGSGNHVQCVTCHWAHGSPEQNADNLRWNMTNNLLNSGSQGCQTCHAK